MFHIASAIQVAEAKGRQCISKQSDLLLSDHPEPYKLPELVQIWTVADMVADMVAAVQVEEAGGQ